MARIRYQHSHSLDLEDARRRVRQLMQQFSDKYKFTTRWEHDTLALVKGRGVKGSVELRPTEILFDLSLSLILTPFKARIRDGIASRVRRALRA